MTEVLIHQKSDFIPKIVSHPSVKALLNLALNYANILSFVKGTAVISDFQYCSLMLLI